MNLPTTLVIHNAVPFTPSRRLELLEELAKTLSDRDRIKDHNDDIQKKAKEILKARDGRIKELTESLTLGSEMIPRDCTIQYDFVANKVKIRDAKTKDIIEERAMNTNERMTMQNGKSV